MKTINSAQAVSNYMRQQLDYAKLKNKHDVVLDPYISFMPAALSNWAGNYLEIAKYAAEAKGKLQRKIVVYIIDTAGKIDHPDLVQYVRNDLAVDRTGEGLIENNGHGTGCASCYVGKQNGAGPFKEGFVTVVPLKGLRGNGSGSYTSIAGCVDDAVKIHNKHFPNHLGIISMSLGGGAASTLLQQAIQKAKLAGLWIAASSGNSGYSEIENRVKYPAKFPEVWAIGATDVNGNVATFSSAGEEVVMAGPGRSVQVAWMDGSYINANGTSFGMPYTMAAVCWIAARFPQLRTMEQALDFLKKHVRDLVKIGKDVGTGYGCPVLDAFVGKVPGDQSPPPPPTEPAPEPKPDPEPPTRQPRRLQLYYENQYQIDWKNQGQQRRHFLKINQLVISLTTTLPAENAYDAILTALEWFFKNRTIILSVSRNEISDDELLQLITFSEKVKLKRPYLEFFSRTEEKDFQDAAYWTKRFIEVLLKSRDLQITVQGLYAEDEKGRKAIIIHE